MEEQTGTWLDQTNTWSCVAPASQPPQGHSLAFASAVEVFLPLPEMPSERFSGAGLNAPSKSGGLGPWLRFPSHSYSRASVASVLCIFQLTLLGVQLSEATSRLTALRRTTRSHEVAVHLRRVAEAILDR
eukprot:scaffold192_cov190-Pinguiococcus_pyrenoidosus.AAC.14